MSQPEKPLSRWIIDNFAGLSGTSAQEIALRAKVDHRLPICQLTEENVSQIARVFSNLRDALLNVSFQPHVYFSHDTKEPIDFWLFPMNLYDKISSKPLDSIMKLRISSI